MIRDSEIDVSVTVEFIAQTLDSPWDFEHLKSLGKFNRLCETIDTDLVSKHPEINWKWTGLSRNPNVTIEFVKANITKPWNWTLLYSTFAQQERCKQIQNDAARVIQRGLHNWLYSPVCKDGTLGINCRPEFVRRALGKIYTE